MALQVTKSGETLRGQKFSLLMSTTPLGYERKRNDGTPKWLPVSMTFQNMKRIGSRIGSFPFINVAAEVNCLTQHFPRKESGWEYARDINLGEFVHFFSGAANTDLKPYAVKAFSWDNKSEKELLEARKSFPEIWY